MSRTAGPTLALSLSIAASLALPAGLAASATAPTGPSQPPPAPEAVVERQLEAYNARDLAAFLATYSEDSELYEYPGKLVARGRTELGERYAVRFREPNLHGVILRRTVMGSFVVDHERVTRTFPEGTGTVEAVVLYEVRDGRIVKATLVPGPKALDTAR